MDRWKKMGLVLTLALTTALGCDEAEGPGPEEDPRGDQRAGRASDPTDDEDDAGDDDLDLDDGFDEEVPSDDQEDAGATPRTGVPQEVVGAWEHGSIDFALWENYREGYYAGRDAAPSREAMIIGANGDAKFYRYEFGRWLYEELIDCEGTVAFHGDGTFTFYPVKGRKRFNDFRTPSRTVDRALTAQELASPKLAGTRAYAVVPGADPAALRITVPSSAPYNWYKKQ